jgi:hypothetical protein
MEFKFNVSGSDRKEFCKTLGRIVGAEAKYIGGSYHSFKVGEYLITADGTLITEDSDTTFETDILPKLQKRGYNIVETETENNSENADNEGTDGTSEQLAPDHNLEHFELLTKHGTFNITKWFESDEQATENDFKYLFEVTERKLYCQQTEHGNIYALVGEQFEEAVEEEETEEDVQAESLSENANESDSNAVGQNVDQLGLHSLTIEMPLDGFTPDKLENLKKLVASKEPLLKKSLKVDELPIEIMEDKVRFPWFSEIDGDKVKAYAIFIHSLCETAKKKKRVVAKPIDSDNPRFSMRVWLISLGMIGDEYSETRKLMISPLEGCSGFRYGTPDRKKTAENVAEENNEEVAEETAEVEENTEVENDEQE